MASYEQNKSSKLWSARFRDSSGHQRRLSGFKTKREAQEAYNEYKAKEGEIATGASITMEELVALYLVYLHDRTKQSSQSVIRERLTRHVVPHFTGRRINDITPFDILRWQQGLSGFSLSYRKTLRTAFTSLLRYGERYHRLRNVMPQVDTIRDPDAMPKEMQVWSPDQMHLFLETLPAVMPDPTWALFYKTLYVSGCRRGELQALQRGCVGDTYIKIVGTVTAKAGETWSVSTPKNPYSVRTISMPASIMVAIHALLQTHDGPFVFGGDRPLPNTSIDRYFKAAAKAAGLPIIRIHDIRHSCASYLISEGVDIVTVSKRLGHKDIEQTLNTYAHCFKQGVDKSVEAFDKCCF